MGFCARRGIFRAPGGQIWFAGSGILGTAGLFLCATEGGLSASASLPGEQAVTLAGRLERPEGRVVGKEDRAAGERARDELIRRHLLRDDPRVLVRKVHSVGVDVP